MLKMVKNFYVDISKKVAKILDKMQKIYYTTDVFT